MVCGCMNEEIRSQIVVIGIVAIASHSRGDGMAMMRRSGAHEWVDSGDDDDVVVTSEVVVA
jgi:hypothetical protein